ncbi:hypothetical protein ACWD8L_25005 [Streptomyces sp. NPDC005133]
MANAHVASESRGTCDPHRRKQTMTFDRAALRTSWNQTHGHLDAARVHLTGLPNIDLSATLEFLKHNELELAFDCMVDLGDDLVAHLLAAPRPSSP